MTRWVLGPFCHWDSLPWPGWGWQERGAAGPLIGPGPCPEASTASGEGAGALGASAGPRNPPLLDMSHPGDLMNPEQGWVCSLKSWQGLLSFLEQALSTLQLWVGVERV